jgi:rhizosphere induced protein
MEALAKDTTVGNGKLAVANDFDSDNDKLQIAVCMSSVPTFVMHAEPGGNTNLDIHPTYYVATTAEKIGTVISASFVSYPT